VPRFGQAAAGIGLFHAPAIRAVVLILRDDGRIVGRADLDEAIPGVVGQMQRGCRGERRGESGHVPGLVMRGRGPGRGRCHFIRHVVRPRLVQIGRAGGFLHESIPIAQGIERPILFLVRRAADGRFADIQLAAVAVD